MDVPEIDPPDRAKAAWLYAQFVVSKTVDTRRSHIGLTFVRNSTVNHESFTERASRLGGLIEFYRSPDRTRWTPTGVNVPDYAKMAQLWWQEIGNVNSGVFTPQEAMDRLASEMDLVMARMQAADEAAEVYGGCGPRLNEEKDPSEWLGTPNGPKAKLEDEDPPGITMSYDELLRLWESANSVTTPILRAMYVIESIVALKDSKPSASIAFELGTGERVLVRSTVSGRFGLWAEVQRMSEDQEGIGFIFLDNDGLSRVLSRTPVSDLPPESEVQARGPILGPQDGVASGRTAGIYGRKLAIVIGISDYLNMPEKSDSVLTDLKYAEKDAADFAELLRNTSIFGKGWEIRELKGPKATEGAIEALIDEIFAGPRRENDLIYFFFAGHGRVNPSNSRDVRLLAYDSDVNKDRAGIDYASFRRNFHWTRAGYAVAFIDACRSGSIGLGRGADRPDHDLIGEVREFDPTKVIFAAGSGVQRAFEDPDLKNGVFTHFLIRGLLGEAGNHDRDSFVDLAELEEFVADKVAKHTANHPLMARQTPRVFDAGGSVS